MNTKQPQGLANYTRTVTRTKTGSEISRIHTNRAGAALILRTLADSLANGTVEEFDITWVQGNCQCRMGHNY